MVSPKIAEFLEELFADWEDAIDKYLKDDEDVLGAFKAELQNKALKYENVHPPTNAGQRQFWETIRDFVQEVHLDSANNPFMDTLNQAVRDQERARRERREDAEKEVRRIQSELQRVELRAEEKARDSGFIVQRTPTETIIMPAIAEGKPTSEAKAELERIESITYLGAAKARLDRLERTSDAIKSRLEEQFPRLQEQIDGIASDIGSSTDVRELNVGDIPERIARLPSAARDRLVRMVKIRNEQLLGFRQPVRVGLRRR